jgi:hypothetical protein
MQQHNHRKQHVCYAGVAAAQRPKTRCFTLFLLLYGYSHLLSCCVHGYSPLPLSHSVLFWPCVCQRHRTSLVDISVEISIATTATSLWTYLKKQWSTPIQIHYTRDVLSVDDEVAVGIWVSQRDSDKENQSVNRKIILIKKCEYHHFDGDGTEQHNTQWPSGVTWCHRMLDRWAATIIERRHSKVREISLLSNCSLPLTQLRFWWALRCVPLKLWSNGSCGQHSTITSQKRFWNKYIESLWYSLHLMWKRNPVAKLCANYEGVCLYSAGTHEYFVIWGTVRRH